MRENRRIAVKFFSGCLSDRADLSQKESILIETNRVEARYVKRKYVVDIKVGELHAIAKT